MNKIAAAISRLTGSYSGSIYLVAIITAAWPSILMGYFFFKNVLSWEQPDALYHLLLIALALAAGAISFVGCVFGLFTRLKIPAWLPGLRELDAMVSGDKVLSREEYFARRFPRPFHPRKTKSFEIKPVEDYTAEEKEIIYQRALTKALFSIIRYPRLIALLALVFAFLLVGIPLIYAEYVVNDGFGHIGIIIPALVIILTLLGIFMVILLDLLTGPLRSTLRRRLKVHRNVATFSLRFKFTLQILIIVLSLCALFIVMIHGHGSTRSTIFFILILSAISIYLTTLYIKSILRNLREITGAVRDLGEGGSGELFMSGLDRELTELGNNFNRTATEVVDYRRNLEKRVAEKTRELAEANANLIDKDKLIQLELDLAADIQEGLYPRRKSWRSLRFSYFYRPMVKVSGDYFDMIPLSGNRLAVFMADVSGHGVPAALITTMAKLSLVSHSQTRESTSEILYHLNRDLVEHVKTQDYMTAFLLIVDSRYHFTYTNAAHQKILYQRRSGRIEELDTDGAILGALEEIHQGFFEEKKGVLENGERIILYTDGILEARNPLGEEFGLDRLKDFITQHHGETTEILKQKFEEYFYDFVGAADFNDDLTFLVLELTVDGELAPGEKPSRIGLKSGLLLARQHLEKREISEGVHILLKLLDLYPGDPQVLHPLARVKAENGFEDEARDLLVTLDRPVDKIRNQDLAAKIRRLAARLNLEADTLGQGEPEGGSGGA